MTDQIVTPASANSGGVRPVPDPTLLTIDALRREIAMLENLIDTRLTEMEKLTIERFKAVDVLMDRGEEQRREQKHDTAAAVDAALESQKEATAKMERSISDQMASLRANFETEMRSIRSSLGDLKDRMTVLESIRQGTVEQKTERRQSTAGVYAAITVAVTVILAVVTVIGFTLAGG